MLVQKYVKQCWFALQQIFMLVWFQSFVICTVFSVCCVFTVHFFFLMVSQTDRLIQYIAYAQTTSVMQA